ncbi:MAG: bifunctional folylpolyglutamate synthase/dihydrofolate synthase [Hydrogeniiclostridium mannosilyticum]
MTYEEAVHTVDSLQRFVRRPGLERIERLLAEMGNPHKALRFVHVAGTNGKGSVSEMIAKVLERAGYRTGLFISPHVTDFCERIQVNGIPIPHGDLTELVEEYLPLIRRLEASGIQVTEFEWITALGFEWFRRQDCQLVVLEVGLGGRFDATNIIDAPLVSVITSISLDHTAVLGDSTSKLPLRSPAS